MSSTTPLGPVIRFGSFELDTESGELRKHGRKTRLTPQAFEFLMLLLANRGHVVTREALRQQLWPADTFVDFDMGLSSAVKKLREALGDSADKPRFIETLPRRGYRFIAEVDDAAPPAPPLVSAESTSQQPTIAPGPPVVRSRRAALVTGVVALAVLALAAAGVWRWVGGPMRAAGPPVRSVAVLPLENLSADASQDYFADGMTDALITDLAQGGGLRVTSRTSVMQYKGTRKPVPTIGRELGVDAVVEGTVVRVGQRVRVTAQLVHAATDRHLWAHTYERELRDVLGLQAEIAGAIAHAVEAEVQPHARAAARTVDPEAYEAYLRGRFHWSARQPDDLLQAVEQFQRAIDRDPTYAPAWSGLSDTYRLFDLSGLGPPAESMPRAEAAARKALELDPSLADAHASLATVLFRYDWDWTAAEKEYRRALELDGSYAEAHRAYAVYLLCVDRPEEAVAEAQRARELSPLSPVVNTELGLALSAAGRADEAIDQLRRTVALQPGFVRAWWSLGLACRRKGDATCLQESVDEALALSGPGPRSNWVGYIAAVAGRRREALEILAELETTSRREYVSPQSAAVIRMGLGDADGALAGLKRAYGERAIEWLGFATEVTDRLHDDRRFQALRVQLGLPGIAAAPHRVIADR